MRLTLVHPAMGRRPGQRFLRTWQIEPLPPAVIAALTPKDVEVRFYDDRMETIPFDEPADLVGISVETYTARRAYQIATEYRRRGVPVVMGGFHATLCPDEVSRYAEAVVVGEAEDVWAEVVDDFRHRTPKRLYRAPRRPSLDRSVPDRSIFQGKRYLPLALLESGRGCSHVCDFCVIQKVYSRTRTLHPVDHVVEQVRALKGSRELFFFVDDNFGNDPGHARELLEALAPLKVRWVSQCSIEAAHDEELLGLMERAGCAGLLIGFETLEAQNLKAMAKGFNALNGGYAKALENLRRRGIRLYGTFVFGYDGDTAESFRTAVEFSREHAMFLAAFAHLMPLPGTALYERLRGEGRLLYDRWWLDPEYTFNKIAFRPAQMSPEELRESCLEARRAFYSWPSVLQRGFARVNRRDAFMWRAFFLLNAMHRAEVPRRDGHPLGDLGWEGQLLEAA